MGAADYAGLLLALSDLKGSSLLSLPGYMSVCCTGKGVVSLGGAAAHLSVVNAGFWLPDKPYPDIYDAEKASEAERLNADLLY